MSKFKEKCNLNIKKMKVVLGYLEDEEYQNNAEKLIDNIVNDVKNYEPKSEHSCQLKADLGGVDKNAIDGILPKPYLHLPTLLPISRVGTEARKGINVDSYTDRAKSIIYFLDQVYKSEMTKCHSLDIIDKALNGHELVHKDQIQEIINSETKMNNDTASAVIPFLFHEKEKSYLTKISNDCAPSL
ncbi:hypothetical protein L3V83_15485 [Thiotrichales bacterium 19X7-9]|nr:hypothetical protein [Thiotrichales bacterium 19X7-9]